VVVHIETPQAVENIEEILSVRGIDVCFIGPTDLSVSMGYATEGPAHPEVRKAMEHVLKMSGTRGLPVGTLAGGAAALQQMMRWGTTYTAVGITSLLNQAFDAVVKAGARGRGVRGRGRKE
jgi:4-hydroxy-2-oxoheptanedioate aldolase